MTTLEFIAEIIGAIAWPAVVLVILYILRDSITQSLPSALTNFLGRHNLDRVKMKGVEIAFSVAVDEVTQAAVSATSTGKEPDFIDAYKDLIDKARAIARISPETGVIFCWIQLQHEINMAAHRLGMQQISRSPPTTAKCRQVLFMHGGLNKDHMRLIESMHSLRNEVLYSSIAQVSEEIANNYAINTAMLTNVLRQLKNINA